MEGDLAAKPWYRPTFYGVIAAATIAGIGLNLLRIDPIRALFLTAGINGLVAPPLMLLIVLLGSDRKVMSKRASGAISKALTWTATIVMSAAMALVITSLPIVRH